jgi:hypothetical protein
MTRRVIPYATRIERAARIATAYLPANDDERGRLLPGIAYPMIWLLALGAWVIGLSVALGLVLS